jgi:hypothetical protein
MGKSVIRGETAILIPSVLLCVMVSVITRANKGPGDIPAVRPSIAPVIIKYIISPERKDRYKIIPCFED